MTKILIADKLAEFVTHELQSLGFEVQTKPDLSADDLPRHVGDVGVLIVRSTQVTKATLEAGRELSLIIRAGAGVNTINVETASNRGISVANCPGKNAAAVAELTIGLMVAADRRISFAHRDMQDGRWRKKEYGNSHGLKGRTLGLLGFGSIGKAVAQAAIGMQMDVLAWSRSLTPESADEFDVRCATSPKQVAQESDVVSVHLALTPETKHLVSTDFLAAMRPGAILINTSRGPLVDTAALIQSINEKQLRVGLDVYENEPESTDGDFGDTQLSSLATTTPHLGASTAQTSEAIAAEVVRIIQEYAVTGQVAAAVNFCAKSPATHTMVVRHLNHVGVLASVLDGLREESINVEEMENTIFEGARAAVCSLRLDAAPSEQLIASLSQNDDILQISVSSNQ